MLPLEEYGLTGDGIILPYRTRIQNGRLNRASGWHNKLRARIILRANPRTFFCHPCDPPPPPFIFAPQVQSRAKNGGNIQQQMEEILLSKNQVYWRINQVLDGNWTNTGRPKVNEIEYNTVSPLSINLTSMSSKRAQYWGGGIIYPDYRIGSHYAPSLVG